MNTPDTTYVRLLDSLSDHLAACPLPAEIASMEVGSNSLDGEHARVHLRSLELAELAEALLSWAHTLTEISATAWRPPHGNTVHLSITGRLGGGLAVMVYGAVSYTEPIFGADLRPDRRQSLALSVLREWSTGGAVVA